MEAQTSLKNLQSVPYHAKATWRVDVILFKEFEVVQTIEENLNLLVSSIVSAYCIRAPEFFILFVQLISDAAPGSSGKA